jgi:hypothetical protein
MASISTGRIPRRLRRRPVGDRLLGGSAVHTPQLAAGCLIELVRPTSKDSPIRVRGRPGLIADNLFQSDRQSEEFDADRWMLLPCHPV